MIRNVVRLFVIGSFVARAVVPVAAAEPGPDFGTVYQRIKPSVVYIVVATATGVKSGSGFIYDSTPSRSIVATVDHVIADGNRIDVVLDGDMKKRYAATVLQHDRKHDVAFLAIDAPNRVPLRLADRDQIGEGNPIAVVGYPRSAAAFKEMAKDDLRPSLHAGIISAVRSNGELVQIDVQTDHGDSGGPVIDSRTGRVVGVVRGGLVDGASAIRGIEQPLPGSAFAVGASTLYAVRNGLLPSADAPTTALAGPGSAAYRVAFAVPRGGTPVVSTMMVAYTDKLRAHFTRDNALYAVPGVTTVLSLESAKIGEYCDGLRTNAIIVPSYTWHVDEATPGTAKMKVELTIADCAGIPYYVGVSDTTEPRNGREPVKKQVDDLADEGVTKVLAAFDVYRTAHAAAWTNLLEKGVAADPNAPLAPLAVGLALQDAQLRVRAIRDDGRGAKAGLQAGDVVAGIDGSPVPAEMTPFEAQVALEAAATVEVKRPQGSVVVKLR